MFSRIHVFMYAFSYTIRNEANTKKTKNAGKKYKLAIRTVNEINELCAFLIQGESAELVCAGVCVWKTKTYF